MNDRRRNFWGWGYQDQFPSDRLREALLTQLAERPGFENLKLHPLPVLENIQLPPSRVPPNSVPCARQSSNTADRVLHTYGRSAADLIRGFAGNFENPPDVVVWPEAEADIQAVLAYCQEKNMMVVPFGGGTSVTSGVEAVLQHRYSAVVSMDLTLLERVLEIDLVSNSARIQAGATGPAIEEQLAPHGMTLRHYPQSFEFSTLGGWLATRSGGHFATVYTHIDDLVESIRLVTPAGCIQTRRIPASGAGPDANRLLLGSEGIFGIIVEASMRIQRRPTWRISAAPRFDSFKNGVAATRAISQSGLFPSNCRLLDANEVRLHRVADDGSCVLLLGFESADHPLQAWMDRALELAYLHGGSDPDGPRERQAVAGGTSDTWRSAFMNAPYLQSALISLGVIADTFETAITWDRFEAFHQDIISSFSHTMNDSCGGGLISCRFTHVYPNGPAPYYTFVVPGGDAPLQRWTVLKRLAGDLLLKHGATITHHHSVGHLHRPWYEQEQPPLFSDLLRTIKKQLDPNAILNPGVLIEP